MHEMTEHDSAMYYKKPAWHGLGTVIEEATSVNDALTKSGLDWSVYTAPIQAAGIFADDHKAVIRDDIKKVLGVVSPQYKVVQNHEVFSIAEAFGNEVVVESAGSVQDGRKAYLMLKGDSFKTNYDDDICKYMALMWSHDKSQSITIIPTSIRIVCKNTLDMVLGSAKSAQNKIVLKHHGDIDEKINQAKEAIGKFKETGKFFETQVQSLANTAPSRRDVTQFFLDVYQRMNKVTITSNPVSAEEEQTRLKALTSVSEWTNTFEEEGTTCGYNYWVAANAVTNSIQHRVAARGKKKSPASRAYSNLIGDGAKSSRQVVEHALQMV